MGPHANGIRCSHLRLRGHEDAGNGWKNEGQSRFLSLRFRTKETVHYGAGHGSPGADPYFFVFKTTSRHAAPKVRKISPWSKQRNPSFYLTLIGF